MNPLLVFAISLLLPVIPAPKEARMSDRPFDRAHLNEIRYVKTGKLAEEGYELKIRRNGITIRYSTDAGRFYAEKTLGQLARGGEMHLGVIRDEPRYAWRGFMLDEARHFLGKEKIKQVLDVMAEFKLNRFHWHLSDTQGWRIEIRAFPELTSVGAVGNRTDPNAPAAFYTREDIREIVRYASERHIEIIPEIDVPGHSKALVKSIPGIGEGNTLNPARERTYEVLSVILREVAELFPGRYLHVGGDEVRHEAWKDLPDVAALMEREGLGSLTEVQDYFSRRVSEIVTSLGKTVMGWDDMRSSGVSPENLVVHWWQTRFYEEKFHDSLRKGYRVVACPNIPMYFDYRQEDFHRFAFGKNVSRLREIYEFTTDDNPLVIGLQVNLWGELVHNSDRLDFMTYPRLFAFAEAAWTERRDYPDFLGRLENVYEWMDGIGLYYYDIRNPEHHPEPSYP